MALILARCASDLSMNALISGPRPAKGRNLVLVQALIYPNPVHRQQLLMRKLAMFTAMMHVHQHRLPMNETTSSLLKQTLELHL